jgi:hypothetical protein
MGAIAVADAARQALGPVGVMLPVSFTSTPPVDLQREAADREWGSPLATMRAYLDRMDGQISPPAPDVAYPRIMAANGPDKLLVVAVPTVVGPDRDQARGAAREIVPTEIAATVRAHLVGVSQLEELAGSAICAATETGLAAGTRPQ